MSRTALGFILCLVVAFFFGAGLQNVFEPNEAEPSYLIIIGNPPTMINVEAEPAPPLDEHQFFTCTLPGITNPHHKEIRMAFVITHDHLENQAVNIVGPRGYDGDGTEIVGNGTKFQMFDGDGELYYTGYCTGQTHEPLDRFGGPMSGATEIRYLGHNGHYHAL